MNVFDVDDLRKKIAVSGELDNLRNTYSEEYPEVEDISTHEKWDSLAGMEFVPEIRVKRLEKVAELIKSEKKILDIGVGWGDIVHILHERNLDFDYTGIDFSEEIIKRLCDKYPENKFIKTTAGELNEKYDYILVLEVLEHIVPSKTFDFIKDVHRLLNDNGTLIVTVPLNENLKDNTSFCGKCGAFINKMGHVRDYSPELIKAELKIGGFDTVSSEFVYQGYYGMKGLVKRLLRNIAGSFLGPSGYKSVVPSNIILELRKAPGIHR